MQKKILIVDDQILNRKILHRLLCDDYEIVEAKNGAEALDILQRQGDRISAVLLDLIMPVMGGYDVLRTMAESPALSAIPVIVASQADKDETEEKALELGARDFVSKPYNPAVLRKRLANLIELYESNTSLHQLERDTLTGLYTKDAFCRRAGEQLTQLTDSEFTLIITDIERFKLVNDSFGSLEGDKLLKFTAKKLEDNIVAEGGICARFSADHFAALLPRQVDEQALEAITRDAEQSLESYPLGMRISLKFGVYPIHDRTVPVTLMCDRATLAADSVKGQYHCVYAFYDDSIRQRMLKEQAITNAMNDALAQGQFQVYLQPKYNLQSEHIAGAEALVRWIHPTMGFMNPGEFIPLFERNGFITELDEFVWDKTCEIIAGWIQTGKKYVPVSVNVSRRDIYQADLPDILTKIVQKHGLRPNQLHLEITETAYTENPEQLIEVVGHLKQLGFVIEMDDFGSGYSSLNMLSELPIDILKLDIRFIQKETDKNSSRNILSFIISLAKWMNLLVIAEGVETQEQVDLLRNMDCNYVQGFYYAKPMPAPEFSQLVLTSELAEPDDGDDRDWQTGTLEITESSAGGKVMLIVDDIQLNRVILSEYFREAYTIVEADNGLVAYQYIQEHPEQIAVIMLDLVMPVMDGFQLLKRLRADPMLANIPVIVTSQAGEASEIHAFELGASDFLSKPYNMDIALHRVQNVTARNAVQTLEREKRMLSKMKQLALEAKLDQLTGVYNRMELERQVELFFSTSEDKHALFFMLDIDNFKTINDRFGHDRGDEAIRSVANKLQELFREDDIVCRMGGDEFAVFMRARVDEDKLGPRLDRMCDALRFRVDDMDVSCSIGVCIAPEHGREYQDVYHNADVALLTAKRLGKNRWQIYGGVSELPDQVLYRNMDWLLDESSDAIVVCDAETYEVYYLNDVACAMSGKDKQTCLSQPCYQALWNNDSPCTHCVHIDKLSRDYCEHEVQPEGTDRTYLVKGKLIEWGSRKARIQYIQDNTSRAMLAQQMSELSEDRRRLLDLLPSGLIRYNAATHEFNFVSENTPKMLGYTREEFIAKFENRFDKLVWHEDRDRVLGEIEEQLKTSDFDTCEYRVERKDGSLCWFYDVGYLFRDGDAREFYVILTDMSAQKAAEERSRQLTQRLESIIDNVPGALCMYRWDGKDMTTLQVSRQFPLIVGGSINAAIANAKNVHPEDLPQVQQAMRRVLFDGADADCIFRIYNETQKTYLWLRMQASSKKQSDGSLLVFTLYTDISELHQLRIEVQEQRDMLTAAMEHSGMSSWVYDFATRSISVPEQAQSQHHLPAAISQPAALGDKLGTNAESIVSQHRDMIRQLCDGAEQAVADVMVPAPDGGEAHWQRLRYTVIRRDSDGAPEKAIGTALDITDQKLAEQKYEQEAVYLNALSSSLVASYRINLTTGAVEQAYSTLNLIPDAKSIHFDDLTFRGVCDKLVPDPQERETCYATFCPSQLRQNFFDGKSDNAYRYQAQLSGQTRVWVSIRVKVVRKPFSEDLMAFFSFWNQEKD